MRKGAAGDGFESSGEKDKAIMCLDRIESYMKEQHKRDNELHSNVINRLSSGESFVFSEGGATSALEGESHHFVIIISSTQISSNSHYCCIIRIS